MSTVLETIKLTREYGGGKQVFGRRKPLVKAVNAIDMKVEKGEILGIVGESGCGKSTFARALLGIERETAGSVKLDGAEVSGVSPEKARKLRRAIQYVHQDPGAALDPWWRIGDTLDETMRIHGVSSKQERQARIAHMLVAVGLDESFASRYPHELSGGQQRRIGLARTLSLHPRIVILDEPTSGLDLSVQASVLKLMLNLHREFDLTYLFISHDLSVVKNICDRVAIMYLGRIVEIGAAQDVFANPIHPYTQALLAAAPSLVRKDLGAPIVGDPPSAANLPAGCAFHTRCPMAVPECRLSVPVLTSVGGTHQVACPPKLNGAL